MNFLRFRIIFNNCLYVCMYVCIFSLEILAFFKKIRNVYDILKARHIYVFIYTYFKGVCVCEINLFNFLSLSAAHTNIYTYICVYLTSPRLKAALSQLLTNTSTKFMSFVYYISFLYKYFKKNLMTFMHTFYHWLKII